MTIENKLEEANRKHWEDFKNSPEFGTRPYLPLFVSTGMITADDIEIREPTALTEKEKSDKYIDEHPCEAGLGAVRGLALVAFSIWTLWMAIASVWTLWMAIASAMEEKWDKGIFFLIAMLIIDKAIDKVVKNRERKINENIRN